LSYRKFKLLMAFIVFEAFFPKISLASHARFNKLQPLNYQLSGKIQSIVQDDNSYIWLATDNNLLRFDGYNIRPYSDLTKEQTNNKFLEPYKLFKSKNGDLWISTKRNGLFKITEDTLFSFKNHKGNITENVTVVFEDSENNMWLGIEAGIIKLSTNGKKSVYKFSDNNSNFHITAITNLSNNNLLVATNNGLFTFDKISLQFKESYPVLNKVLIYTFFTDKENAVWV